MMAATLPLLENGMSIRDSYHNFMENIEFIKAHPEGGQAAIMEISLADYRCFLHLSVIDDESREMIFKKELPLHVSAEIAIGWYHDQYDDSEALLSMLDQLHDEEKKLSRIVGHRLESGLQPPKPIDAHSIFKEEGYYGEIASIRKSRGCEWFSEKKESGWRRTLMRYQKWITPSKKQMDALFTHLILPESDDVKDPWVGEISTKCPLSVKFVEKYREYYED